MLDALELEDFEGRFGEISQSDEDASNLLADLIDYIIDNKGMNVDDIFKLLDTFVDNAGNTWSESGKGLDSEEFQSYNWKRRLVNSCWGGHLLRLSKMN